MRPSIELAPHEAKRALTEVLRRAHAGERGAALAYAGHWRSLRKPDEIAAVRQIEADELEHRARVGEMLHELGATPEPWRERLMALVGTAIGLLCRFGGWLVPMYGAGRLESGNVREYEDAARFASVSGHGALAPDLLRMAEVEWDHERYFRSRAEGHWLGAHLPLWESPLPRETIRASFDDFSWLRRYRRDRVRRAVSYRLVTEARFRSLWDAKARCESCRRARPRETVSERIRPILCP